MSIEKLLENKNVDLDLSKRITMTPRTENIKLDVRSDSNYFDNIVHAIINDNEILANIENTEIYYRNKIIELCNDISQETIDNYKYSKNIKIQKIQRGLQLSNENINTLSALLYLRDYYKKNYILVSDKILYDDTIKMYEKVYILSENNKFRVVDKPEYTKIMDSSKLIEKDIRGNIYDVKIDNITKYKLPELVELAKEYKLDTNGKKKELYDRIYKYLVNN